MCVRKHIASIISKHRCTYSRITSGTQNLPKPPKCNLSSIRQPGCNWTSCSYLKRNPSDETQAKYLGAVVKIQCEREVIDEHQIFLSRTGLFSSGQTNRSSSANSDTRDCIFLQKQSIGKCLNFTKGYFPREAREYLFHWISSTGQTVLPESLVWTHSNVPSLVLFPVLLVALSCMPSTPSPELRSSTELTWMTWSSLWGGEIQKPLPAPGRSMRSGSKPAPSNSHVLQKLSFI